MIKNIIILEDDENIRKEMLDFFKNDEWKSIGFSNGQKAIDFLDHNTQFVPSAIILDLKMPEMGGEIFLSVIKSYLSPLPPIVVLSGFLNNESMKKCAELGANCLLKKPIDNNELFKIIICLVTNPDGLDNLTNPT